MNVRNNKSISSTAAAYMPIRRCRHRAFTLVELLVTMLLIMILVAIGLPVARYISERVIADREGLMDRQIRDAIEAYRLTYGEYPVPGDPRHYPTNYLVDPDRLMPSQYRYINLAVNPPVETLDFSTTYNIDWSLVWPLMVGPMEQGEPPFMVFDKIVVTYLFYRYDSDTTRVRTRRTQDGGELEAREATGDPIERYLAISPTTGRQYRYWSDGENYEVCPGNCDNPSNCKACTPP